MSAPIISQPMPTCNFRWSTIKIRQQRLTGLRSKKTVQLVLYPRLISKYPNTFMTILRTIR